jgi:hypothetical protein
MNEDDFTSLVRVWAGAALERFPQMDFDGLVRALPGVYPSDVARILGDLTSRPFRAKGSIVETPTSLKGDGLPVPHPLDYDWRFSEATQVFLSQRVASLLPKHGAVTLLGAPSLFERLLMSRPDARIQLADGSAETISFLTDRYGKRGLFARNLLRQSPPRGSVDVVVADPPWYPEYSRAFVWAAGQLVRVGGMLLLCGPNQGTRPDAMEEWEQAKKFAQSFGFHSVDFESVLRYQTPPFEQNALNAAGHSFVSSDWRTGCLATFARKCIHVVDRPAGASEYDLWHQETVGGVRWRLRRMKGAKPVCPALYAITPDDVLDSVSRRDHRRRDVDVWTSGNRVFSCPDTSTLVLILRGLGTGASCVTVVESAIERKLTNAEIRAVEEATRRLTDIISLEQQEYLQQAEDLIVS